MNPVAGRRTCPPMAGVPTLALACVVLLLLVLTGCSESPNPSSKNSKDGISIGGKTREFFTDWLREHGETNVVVDAAGVGLKGSAARLRASLYGSEQHASNSFVAELEFRVHIPSGGEIVEFVAGSGESFDRAVDDALVNFTLTTFHVLYKAFFNPADPH